MRIREVNVFLEQTSCKLISDFIEESVTYLSHFNEPWEEILNHWKKTAKYRHSKGSNNDTVAEFLSKWPILKDIRAEILVSITWHILTILTIIIRFYKSMFH